MATKPVDKPEWAEDDTTLPITGGNNKVRPRVGWRTIGFDLGDFPSAEELNWQFNNVKDWVDWLEQETDRNTSELANEVMKEGEDVSLLNNDADYQNSTQVNALIDAAITTALENYEDLKDPIGTVVYLTAGTDPNTYKRGTWVKTGEGRFIVGQDTLDPDFDTIGLTAGSKTHTHDVSRDGWGEDPVNGPLPSPTTDERLLVGSGQPENGETLESITHAGNDITSTDNSVIPVPYQVMAVWEKTAL